MTVFMSSTATDLVNHKRIVSRRQDFNNMETLEGFPSLPAVWLRRAKPGYANATRLARVDDEIVVAALRGSRILVCMHLVGAEGDGIPGAEFVDLAGHAQVERTT